MTGQTDHRADDFLGRLEEASRQAERLESTLNQLLHVMKARGLMFSDAPALTIQSLRENLTTSRQDAKKAARKLQLFQKLVDISVLLTSSLDLDRVLEQVMDAVISLTGAQRAYLMLRGTDSTELTIRAARNWDGANIDKSEVSFSRSVVNSALEQKQPILTSNAAADSRFQNHASIVALNLRSIACIPFMWHGQVIGVLYTDNRVHEGIFEDDVIPMLTAFANQAAVAIENARLFEQVKTDLDKAKQEVQVLRIQIDQQQADSQIDEIVGSDIFKRLARRENPPTDP